MGVLLMTFLHGCYYFHKIPFFHVGHFFFLFFLNTQLILHTQLPLYVPEQQGQSFFLSLHIENFWDQKMKEMMDWNSAIIFSSLHLDLLKLEHFSNKLLFEPTQLINC